MTEASLTSAASVVSQQDGGHNSSTCDGCCRSPTVVELLAMLPCVVPMLLFMR